MKEAIISLPHTTYSVHTGASLLQQAGSLIRHRLPKARRAAIIGDETAMSFHLGTLERSLNDARFSLIAHSIPSGEAHKTLNTVSEIYTLLLSNKFERSDVVISLGGGVSGDTVGFAAATYLRGVPFVNVPTTLLSMVDASVGGKTGVNMPQGKNLVGAFYQPELVIVDVTVLNTLPQREFVSGLAECVKHAIIRSPELFTYIESHVDQILNKDEQVLTSLVADNVAIKAAVVMADEKESSVRAHLNFGHTFAHAIEKECGYGTYLHGEAVSLGIVAAGYLALKRGLVSQAELDRTEMLLSKLSLPVRSSVLPDKAQLIEAMYQDKKVQNSLIRLVLQKNIGDCLIVNDATTHELAAAWDYITAG
ncbi:MAG: 3-dehydroquinate synthase [bacterium]|nr:3-dehydroquinate synthase [bacterium]